MLTKNHHHFDARHLPQSRDLKNGAESKPHSYDLGLGKVKYGRTSNVNDTHLILCCTSKYLLCHQDPLDILDIIFGWVSRSSIEYRFAVVTTVHGPLQTLPSIGPLSVILSSTKVLPRD